MLVSQIYSENQKIPNSLPFKETLLVTSKYANEEQRITDLFVMFFISKKYCRIP